MLSPMDIRDKTFNVKMRGFDQDQVNDFLDQIIADYETVLKDRDEKAAALKEATEKVTHYEGMKDAMNQAIIVAQEAADRLKQQSEADAQQVQDEAEKNAETLLSEASEKSNRILTDASDKARQLTIQTEDMKRNAQEFRDHLALLLRAELETVEGTQWTDTIGETAAPAQNEAEETAQLQEGLDSRGKHSLHSDADASVDMTDVTGGPVPADDDVAEIVFPNDPIA